MKRQRGQRRQRNPCHHQRDDGRAETAGKLHALLGRLFAVLEIDRVEDRLAAIEL
jgi:hypothetical protein